MEVLILFVRYPEAGRVKTRLAKSVGPEEARRLYQNLTEANLKVIHPLARQGVDLVIAFDPPEQEEAVKNWLRGPYHYLNQGEGGLGERITQGFERVFLGGAKKAIVLGSDTLDLRIEIVKQAYQALESSDLVLGPAKDGGYYLIGLRRPQPRLFQNIPWSTPHVLASTQLRAEQLGLSYSLLEELEDLDEVENREGFRRWSQRNETDVTNRMGS